MCRQGLLAPSSPLCSMQGTGLLGIPAEPLSWVRMYLNASRLEERAGAEEAS